MDTGTIYGIIIFSIAIYLAIRRFQEKAYKKDKERRKREFLNMSPEDRQKELARMRQQNEKGRVREQNYKRYEEDKQREQYKQERIREQTDNKNSIIEYQKIKTSKMEHNWFCNKCNNSPDFRPILKVDRPGTINCPSGGICFPIDLGEVGNVVYQCNKCHIKVMSKNSPHTCNCPKGSIHFWVKM